jgi:ABC-type uncharacterized transport system permease subunit
MILATGSLSTAAYNATVWALVVLTVLAYLTPVLAQKNWGQVLRQRALGLAWALHGCLLVFGLMGTPLRFGFGPALSFTAWLALTVYAIERHFLPQMTTHWSFTALGAATVVLAAIFPGAPLHANASVWMPLHWAFGIASYGLFAAAVLHAWLMNRAEAQIRLAHAPKDGIPLLTLERLMFRFVTLGFCLLTVSLLVGSVFGEALYGGEVFKRWRWDHKTVFSVLSWATFAGLLLGRVFLGWRGRRATRVLYAGAGLLLLAYAGSRFVLEILLGRAS